MKAIYLLTTVLSLSVFGCTENPRVVTRVNQEASLEGNLQVKPLQGRPITFWIDKQNSLMSTLYGNDLAVQYARTNSQHNYPPGSVLSLVTWSQQEDSRWFGAKIPAAPKSVEIVTVGVTSDQKPSYSYQEYEGNPLKKVSEQQGATANDRAVFLLAQRAAVMP